MENTINTESSLFAKPEETNPQAQSDEKGTLFGQDDKAQNAFKIQQQEINSLKAKIKELDAILKNQKPVNSTEVNKPEESKTFKDNNEVAKIIETYKADFDSKLEQVTKQFQQQQVKTNTEKLDKVLSDFRINYGLSGTETQQFVEAIDISGSGFDNTIEGKISFLMNYVDTPKLIEMELVKNSPNAIQAALQRKENINAKTISKQQSATVRGGTFNTNPPTTKTIAEQKVKEFLDKQPKRIKLIPIDKAK